MSYQVLARKWRPQTFHQLVGQQHVKQALVNALNEQRLHHAYLFTGTRGVGKTTIARIFAKSLNCDQGITSNPCGQCSSCQDIESGKFIDLIEIDAASRTKVEDTREILDNVQYAPTRGRYKVYLIDEVHMLSKHSFNALLKTLEEPPEHVKFLLATTDPQKLPVTILSRCLQFNLNAMSQHDIITQLSDILPKEQVKFEDQALHALAKAADGSMRDALSLTDQAIAQTNSDLTLSAVQHMLGLMDGAHAITLLSAIMCQEAQALMQAVDNIATQNGNFISVLDDLIALTHAMQLAQLVPQAARLSDFDPQDVTTLAQQIGPEKVQLFYQLLLNGKRDLKWAPEQKLGFEMLMLRLLAFEKTNLHSAPVEQVSPTEQANNKVGGLRALLNKSSDATQMSDTMQATASQETPVAKPTAPIVSQVEAEPKTKVNIAQKSISQTNTAQKNTPQDAEQNTSVSYVSGESHIQHHHEDRSDDESAQQQEYAVQYEQVMAQANEQGFVDNAAANQHQTPSLSREPSTGQSEQAQQQDVAPHIADKEQQAQSAIARILQNRKISGAGQLLQGQGDEVKKPQAQQAPTSQTTPVKKKPDFKTRHKTDESKLAPELLQQIAPTTSSKKVEPVEPSIPVPNDFSSPISEIKFAHQQDEWAHLIKRMGLGGRMRQFALHSIFTKDQNQFKLEVDQSQQHLDSPMLRQKLIASLSEIYGYEIQLDIIFAPGVIDSPYLIQQKIDAERYQQAVDVINQDSNIVQFVQEFDATVDENTVQAL
ncbi:Holliday junction ATP-dependent DNA helicase RuvB [Pseudoalteromonas holothuriae]|uniref:DNA polymerase III subunit gamma/tau n=1 Tax=Pseudoalteromonas holothuriae TaxID=2963714 RepID=A0ABN8UMN9_9GAMM|nr:DNA polymerase III subunit gamma/tau [Pseudoalteromonas sp. CIP111951]CAH9056859.1 Holliday junction ATP-dependent DNA helicase RuvB [Pseudoalteromonas sp. CIP111951]